MDPLYLITLADGFLHLCIATLSLCCAAAILFRFRAHLLRALVGLGERCNLRRGLREAWRTI